jgi:DNA-binding MarR family transcriptional regulator
MPSNLKSELQQRKPFSGLEQEATLSIARTEAALRQPLEELLKGAGVSLTQYNVLRILRGAGPEGLTRNEIRDRLINRMPDVTRLLDRMEDAGWVTRARETEDRRCVATHLSRSGRALVDSLDAPVQEEHVRRLSHMTRTQLRTLIDLLALARERS